MKKLITRCARCSQCAIEQPIGFTSQTIYRCTERNCNRVEPGDGCTLGIKGTPAIYVPDYYVSIQGDAAAYGCEE